MSVTIQENYLDNVNIETAKLVIENWARDQSSIVKVSLYGSRVKGTHRKNSDLDIAIKLKKNMDESDGLSTWMKHKNHWVEELNELLSYDVHVEWDGGIITPNISMALSEKSIIVYET